MSVFLAYKAKSVGPVCQRLAAVQEGITVVHEEAIRAADLISPPARPQAAPADPLLEAWRNSADLASAFVQVQPSRSELAQRAIDGLVEKLRGLRAAQNIPAPVAPPPVRNEPKVLIRWGSRYEGRADVEINTVDAVRLARDKRESRRVLGDLAPKTWFRQSDIRTPAVIRPRRHHAGNKFFVVRTPDQVSRAIERCGPGWYASELVNKSKEYRVFVLQDRVIRISEKHPGDHEVAWNVGVGGSAKGVPRRRWPLDVAKLALKGARKLGLDWTAIDICVDQAGKPQILEANTAPGLTGATAIEQIAWAFNWIPRNPKPALLNLEAATEWRQLLHPSLAQAAEE